MRLWGQKRPMRPKGRGRGARPARPVPEAPSSLRPPPTALQGRCRGDPSPPEALSMQQAEITAEGHRLSHPGLGDSACHDKATPLFRSLRGSHVTSVGSMQGRGIRGLRPGYAAQARRRAPSQSPGRSPRAAPHTQVPSWPWPRRPPRERHLSAHTPSTAPARLGARPGCQGGEPPGSSPGPLGRTRRRAKGPSEGSTLYGAPPLLRSLSPPLPGQVYDSLWQEGTW